MIDTIASALLPVVVAPGAVAGWDGREERVDRRDGVPRTAMIFIPAVPFRAAERGAATLLPGSCILSLPAPGVLEQMLG